MCHANTLALPCKRWIARFACMLWHVRYGVLYIPTAAAFLWRDTTPTWFNDTASGLQTKEWYLSVNGKPPSTIQCTGILLLNVVSFWTTHWHWETCCSDAICSHTQVLFIYLFFSVDPELITVVSVSGSIALLALLLSSCIAVQWVSTFYSHWQSHILISKEKAQPSNKTTNFTKEIQKISILLWPPKWFPSAAFKSF